ncbi:MAG: hypothetical protein U0487_00685 [Patescibacteria group bacterium]
MKNKRLLGLIAPLAAVTLMTALAVFAPDALAQTADTLGLNDVGQTVKLSGTDPRTIAVNIINASLGFIGIILVGIVLYAGFTWMTSGGDSGKDLGRQTHAYERRHWFGDCVVGMGYHDVCYQCLAYSHGWQ